MPAHEPFGSGQLQLDREQCLRLLRSVGVGRVAWADGRGRVVVEPVNFAVAGDALVFRTGEGDKLAAARGGAPFAFQADELEPGLRTGWSVLVQASVEIVTDPADRERLEALLGPPWDDSAPKPYVVLLHIGEVSGRRLPVRAGGITFGP